MLGKLVFTYSVGKLHGQGKKSLYATCCSRNYLFPVDVEE